MNDLSTCGVIAVYMNDDNESERDNMTRIAILCDEVVALIARSDSPEGPYNQAEALPLSEVEIQLAYERQDGIICRLEHLSRILPSRTAASEAERAAKCRALDAFTSLVSWDWELLRVLRVSIDRDLEYLTQAPHELSLPHSPRQNWLARRLGNYTRAVGL